MILGKILLHIKSAFRFSVHILSEIFLTLRKTYRYIIISANRSSLKAPKTLVCRYAGMQVWTFRPNLHTRRHLHRVTYTRYHIDTFESPDDEHLNDRNLYRIEIIIYKKELCVKLVINL